jgi:hypothetical protein
MTDLQGICEFNPKKKLYMVKIGKLFFPFKSVDEVFDYHLRRIRSKLKVFEFIEPIGS